jgi:excisionase family DNA binding protein
MEGVNEIHNDLGPGFADADRLLKVSEAAVRMGLSARTLRRLVQQRRIRHLRIGRLIRVSSRDVDAFVTDSTVEPVGESASLTSNAGDDHR